MAQDASNNNPWAVIWDEKKDVTHAEHEWNGADASHGMRISKERRRDEEEDDGERRNARRKLNCGSLLSGGAGADNLKDKLKWFVAPTRIG